MPSHWIYLIALLLILAFRVVTVDTAYLAEWFWYNGQPDVYYGLLQIQENPQFKEFAAAWSLPFFVMTVFGYWVMDYDDAHDIGKQFALLPLAYIPFSIIGHALVNMRIDLSTLYIHPLVIVPVGYLYVLPWLLFVWVFCKLRLVIAD